MNSTAGVAEIAKAVTGGATTARAVVIAALARIEANNGRVGAFTDVTSARAMEQAERVDAEVKAGKGLPLAGVPFAVKNLFDLKGVVTRAGSKINRSNAPAFADAVLVSRLEAAGAVCVGALNMDEYAYGFTGENAHDGPVHNPHGLDHMTGGSSAGPAAAVAAGMVPLSLGSDTNGSIRVPASLCGLFGLKPTFGRLSRTGTFPFVADLDHVGPLARSVEDLALAYDALQGFDGDDPALVRRPLEAVAGRLARGAAGLRLAIADGYLGGEGEAREMMETVGKRLEIGRRINIPEVQAARAAAYLITMSQGAALHAGRLGGAGAEVPPLVPRPNARIVQRCRCNPAALDADAGAKARAEDGAIRRDRDADPAKPGDVHAAVFVRRPAGGGGAHRQRGQIAAAGRADRHGALARGQWAEDRAAARDARAGEGAGGPRLCRRGVGRKGFGAGGWGPHPRPSPARGRGR
jgi:aspartyl-tRNA(Asn)/glutamyl-tRNA(Gln) amidotransferase subunit A